MTDDEIDNVQTLERIEQIFFLNRLHEIPVHKLLDWYRKCIHESTATPAGIVLEHRNKAIRLSEAIKFELSAKMTVETQFLIQSQINQTSALMKVSNDHLQRIATLTDVSKNQLEMAKAMVEEAKATTKLSAIIASLTIVLAIETYYLDIPEIIKMGWVQAAIPLVVLGLFLVGLNWHLNRKAKKLLCPQN